MRAIIANTINLLILEALFVVLLIVLHRFPNTVTILCDKTFKNKRKFVKYVYCSFFHFSSLLGKVVILIGKNMYPTLYTGTKKGDIIYY